jgi:hypothetical protein
MLTSPVAHFGAGTRYLIIKAWHEPYAWRASLFTHAGLVTVMDFHGMAVNLMCPQMLPTAGHAKQ